MPVEALIFDVFGTCVDWRSSVARDLRTAFPEADADRLALDWRASYEPAMAPIRTGHRPYIPLETLQAETLADLCAEHRLPAPESPWLRDAWERLDPWPDTVPGLTAMKSSHIIAPCSNGSIRMMSRLAKWAGLPWDRILGADLARDYKPKPDVYLASCAALALAPARVMMVAAHNADLAAARALGLATAFVPRPTEYGLDQTVDLTPDEDWDIVAHDFQDLSIALSR